MSFIFSNQCVKVLTNKKEDGTSSSLDYSITRNTRHGGRRTYRTGPGYGVGKRTPAYYGGGKGRVGGRKYGPRFRRQARIQAYFPFRGYRRFGQYYRRRGLYARGYRHYGYRRYTGLSASRGRRYPIYRKKFRY